MRLLSLFISSAMMLSAVASGAKTDLSTAWTVLGVPEGSSDTSVRAAYDRLIKKHPKNEIKLWISGELQMYPVLTLAKELIEMTSPHSQTYYNMIVLHRELGKPLIGFDVIAKYTPSQWGELSARLLQLYHTNAEILEKAPNREDSITFDEVVSGSVVETLLVKRLNEQAVAIGEKVGMNFKSDTADSVKRSLPIEFDYLYKNVELLTAETVFTFEGKPLIFSDKNVEALFRKVLSRKLMLVAFAVASNRDRVLRNYESNFLEKLNRDPNARIPALIELYRLKLANNMLNSASFEVAAKRPIDWLANSAKARRYVQAQFTSSETRENFLSFITEFANTLPKPVARFNNPVNSIKSAAAIGLVCTAFTLKGGYDILGRIESKLSKTSTNH